MVPQLHFILISRGRRRTRLISLHKYKRVWRWGFSVQQSARLYVFSSARLARSTSRTGVVRHGRVRLQMVVQRYRSSCRCSLSVVYFSRRPARYNALEVQLDTSSTESLHACLIFAREHGKYYHMCGVTLHVVPPRGTCSE